MTKICKCGHNKGEHHFKIPYSSCNTCHENICRLKSSKNPNGRCYGFEEQKYKKIMGCLVVVHD